MLLRAKVFYFILMLACLCGCKFSEDAIQETEASLFTDRIPLGKLDSREVDEVSGMATSRKNDGMIWVHNDSGDQPRFFLLDEQGRLVLTCILQGVFNRDWEDIAIGPGPKAGETYLYVADIGDNKGVYAHKYVYRFLEPQWDGKTELMEVGDVETITFGYPDGLRDAETFMVDPISKDWYLVSKREEKVNVYQHPYPQSLILVDTLTKTGSLPYTRVTAGDISADGSEVLLKSYEWVLYWSREEGQAISDLLKTAPVVLPYEREPQGEAISWRNDGTGYFTLSEESLGIWPWLYRYDRKTSTGSKLH